jgi:glycerate-2-kinase
MTTRAAASVQDQGHIALLRRMFNAAVAAAQPSRCLAKYLPCGQRVDKLPARPLEEAKRVSKNHDAISMT